MGNRNKAKNHRSKGTCKLGEQGNIHGEIFVGNKGIKEIF
jgi:hypothetical protein